MRLKKRLARLLSLVFIFSLGLGNIIANAATNNNYEDTDKNITFTGTWNSKNNSSYSGSSAKFSSTKGGSITSSKDGNYTITATAPAKNAAVSYDIQENNTSIKTDVLFFSYSSFATGSHSGFEIMIIPISITKWLKNLLMHFQLKFN